MKKEFIITAVFLLSLAGLSNLAAQDATNLIQNNQVLAWKTFSNGATWSQGELKIKNVNGNSFDAEQKNMKNTGAGIQTLHGGIFNENTQIVLLNTGQYREVWIGAMSGDKITGRIEGTEAGFEISAKVVAAISWVPYTGSMPANAVKGGSENGSDLMVCRTEYNGAVHPGKVVGGNCNVGWGGKEIVATTFEVLTNDGIPLSWIPFPGVIPANAVVAGSETSGDNAGKSYYVGQFTRPDGSTHSGKIFGVPGGYIFNYSYGGREITEKSNYRMLVQGGN